MANMRLLPPPARAHLADAVARGARHQAAQAQAGVEVELEACTGGLRSRSSAVHRQALSRCRATGAASAGLSAQARGRGMPPSRLSPCCTHDSDGPCTASAVWP